MSDSDLQVELDSDSELPHCNSGFHAHQESPRVFANWSFLPGSPAYQLELAEISPEIADQCMLSKIHRGGLIERVFMFQLQKTTQPQRITLGKMIGII